MKTLGAWDYLALTLYFAGNLLVGWLCARRKPSSDDYLRGGGRVSWWAAGVSFFATGTSSLSFMAIPAMTYATDWLSFGSAIAQVAATLVLAYVFVRRLRRLNLTTIFTYLEMRFSLAVRLLGAALAILLKVGGRMSVIMLLPALALSTVTGLNVNLSILLLGSVTIVYSMLGGFEAVIWTDVGQVVVMFGGVALALYTMIHAVPDGLGGVLQIAQAHGKLHWVSFQATLATPTVWVFVAMGIGSVFSQLADQPLMQRVFATSDPAAARRSVALAGWMGLPSAVAFFFVGTALFVFYHVHPSRLGPVTTDAIFPYFIVNEMPAGVVGLIIAGLFASSMGSLSSSLNATAAIVVTDFYGRFRPQSGEVARVRVARVATLVAGLASTAMALYLASLGVKSLWEQFLRLVALIGGGFPGVFVLGLLTRRANSTGVIIGALSSIAVTAWIQLSTTLNPFAQGFAAIAACCIIGYLASLATGGWRAPGEATVTLLDPPASPRIQENFP